MGFLPTAAKPLTLPFAAPIHARADCKGRKLRKRRKYFLIVAPGKAVRVHRQFMGGSGCLAAPGKTLRGEIASGLGVALQRHQHMGQGAAEQFRVKEIVRATAPRRAVPTMIGNGPRR